MSNPDEKINLNQTSLTPLTTSFEETDYFEDDRCHGYRCENCGFSFTSYYIKIHNYCYNCGAINRDTDFYRKITMAQNCIKNRVMSSTEAVTKIADLLLSEEDKNEQSNN